MATGISWRCPNCGYTNKQWPECSDALDHDDNDYCDKCKKLFSFKILEEKGGELDE